MRKADMPTSIILVLLLYSCVKLTPEQKIIQDTINRTIDLGMIDTVLCKNNAIPFNEFRNRFRNIYLVYLQFGCNPCYPKFVKWQASLDSLNCNDYSTVLFIIRGTSYQQFLSKILIMKPEFEVKNEEFYITMINDHSFLEANEQINPWAIERSVLIDKEDKIKLIGDPFSSPEMFALYKEICKNDKMDN